MRLPNGSGAQVDLRKLTDYVLNPQHPRGRNKARVFAAALNLHRSDAQALRDWLLQVAASADNVIAGPATEYGQTFEIVDEMRYTDRSALVRSAWMIRAGEDFPRLVTVFVE
jgi:hypothetical protein